ncbi:MAG: SPOR domain-containing protein [SAR324 cluster bacterium]|nr:SPOR domain-containing protein [SAR324 cluster bacterium]MBL7034636.1 SPOR domain-containing protein [SAR324 cluster bacterium]
MNKKRTIRLSLLWLATILMGGVVWILLYVQLAVNQENVATSLEIKFPEVVDEKNATLKLNQEGDIVPESGAESASENSEKIEYSHLVETGSPFWNVFPINSAGVSAENWHTILVQNRFKIDYTITPLTPRAWHLIRSNNSIRVQFRSELDAIKDILARKKRGKFSIQLISLENDQFPQAVSLLSSLLNDGHYAYLHRTDAEFDGKFWYRVRVGFFKNLEDARIAGKKIFEKYQDEELFPPKYWPVQPGPQELSRPVIDLRQPLNKPWVIQFPLYSKRTAALKDLALLNTETDFSYISQKLENAESAKLQFRIRIGFFETKKEAGSKIFLLKKKFPQFKSMKRVHL